MAKERIKNEDSAGREGLGWSWYRRILKGNRRKEKVKNGVRRKRNRQGEKGRGKGKSLLRRRGTGNRGRQKKGRERKTAEDK